MALMIVKKADGEDVELRFIPEKNRCVILKGKQIYGVASGISKAYAIFNEIA